MVKISVKYQYNKAPFMKEVIICEHGLPNTGLGGGVS